MDFEVQNSIQNSRIKGISEFDGSVIHTQHQLTCHGESSLQRKELFFMLTLQHSMEEGPELSMKENNIVKCYFNNVVLCGLSIMIFVTFLVAAT